MSDIQHLPDGIYEEVVSQSLEEKIKKHWPIKPYGLILKIWTVMRQYHI